jgi:hypothetical protein
MPVWMALAAGKPAGIYFRHGKHTHRKGDAMVRFAVVTFILSAFALPAFSGTHKQTYPNACSEAWTAVKDTLGDSENYTVKITDEARMAATYNVKHAAHVTITGASTRDRL